MPFPSELLRPLRDLDPVISQKAFQPLHPVFEQGDEAMHARGNQLQVFNAVVAFVAIFVMYMLGGFQRPAEMLGHDQTMLGQISTAGFRAHARERVIIRQRHIPVSAFPQIAPAFPSWVAILFVGDSVARVASAAQRPVPVLLNRVVPCHRSGFATITARNTDGESVSPVVVGSGKAVPMNSSVAQYLGFGSRCDSFLDIGSAHFLHRGLGVSTSFGSSHFDTSWGLALNSTGYSRAQTGRLQPCL